MARLEPLTSRSRVRGVNRSATHVSMGTGDILLGGYPCNGLASLSGGSSNTSSYASCYGNQYKLWLFGPLVHVRLYLPYHQQWMKQRGEIVRSCCHGSKIFLASISTNDGPKIIYSTVPHLFSSYICIKNFTPKRDVNVTKAFDELPLNCKNKDVYSLSVESNKVLRCIFLVTIFRFYTKQSWFLHGRAENGPSEPPVIGQEV